MSNEARARIMFKITGKLRRQLSESASALNGNAVIGVKQSFVVEMDDGKIMGRAIGTAVRMQPDPNGHAGNLKSHFHKQASNEPNLASSNNCESDFSDVSLDGTRSRSDDSLEIRRDQRSHKQSKAIDTEVTHRNSIASIGCPGDRVILSVRLLPYDAISEIGGIVSAVSVKSIEDDSAQTRELWWDELRKEVVSHSRFLFCQNVVGYTETCSVYDNIMILHCVGTAVNLDPSVFNADSQSLKRSAHMRESAHDALSIEGRRPIEGTPSFKFRAKTRDYQKRPRDAYCKILHAPYDHRTAPYPMRLKKCNICRNRYVPEVIFTTLDLPPQIARSSSSELMEAFTSYDLKWKCTKSNASPASFSEVIPFMQYDIHKQFLCKMRLFGFNAIHCLNTQITIVGTSITAFSTGTGLCLYALPVPPLIELKPSTLFDYRSSESGNNPDNVMMRIMDVREEISMEAENAIRPDDICSTSSSSTSTSDASAYVGGTGTTVINLDDEPYNGPLLSIGYISARELRVSNSSSLDGMSNYDHIAQPEVYARPSVVSVIRCTTVSPGSHVARQISVALNQIFDDLNTHFCHFKKCSLANIDYKIMRVKGDIVLIVLTASSLGIYHDLPKLLSSWIPPVPSFVADPPVERYQLPVDSLGHDAEEVMNASLAQLEKDSYLHKVFFHPNFMQGDCCEMDASNVVITPLHYIPNMKISSFLGRISFHLVREASFVYSSDTSDNLSKFHQSFMTEVYAVVRTHVVALGGNAMLGYSIDHVIMNDNFKSHGYAVLSVSGDAVRVAQNPQRARPYVSEI